ncbi:hypothetical protein M409DRAFT_56929 [Zasmidium cellare ATCC 36951]|uniref:Xylanolytic transcriptional activator regulatory domain-containing protein n=1 Tax=Zasmidium cellare ATCC 36951 TaxID=1080233 RepID=A0A6A6CE89_ZASCE|nr:uncharacterized protein M409DRAFT_56929 [Zasmidium cellare ATCC 36951]KAF2164242.1 hypothetical protein M409DRAFT_56929 [Zasmidium cellare ATCC 36951]
MTFHIGKPRQPGSFQDDIDVVECSFDLAFPILAIDLAVSSPASLTGQLGDSMWEVNELGVVLMKLPFSNFLQPSSFPASTSTQPTCSSKARGGFDAMTARNASPGWSICSGTRESVRNAKCATLAGKGSFADILFATDTKEKPFACFCGRTFARSDLLKRHKLRTHSTATAERGTEDARRMDVQGNARGKAVEAQGQDVVTQPTHGQDFREDANVPMSPGQDFPAFVEFVESIGLGHDWDFFDLDPQSAFAFDEPQLPSLDGLGDLATSSQQPTSTSSAARSSAPTTVELSSVADRAGSEQALTPIQWRLSQSQWQILTQKCQGSVSGLTLPSRPAMSRYLQSYVTKFHKHYPMIHLPTYDPVASPLWLTLIMAAVGAQCIFEAKNSYRLYQAARYLTMEQRQLDSDGRNIGQTQMHRIAMIQTLILLMVFSAWDTDTRLLGEALDLQSVVSGDIRRALAESSSTHSSDTEWQIWIREETHRRVILISYAYLVVQSTAYDLPPVVLTGEIQEFILPCGSAEWEARTEPEWRQALRHSSHSTARTGDVLRQLLSDQSGGGIDGRLRFSAVGSFVVVQALIQRIFFARQLHDTSSTALPRAELDVIQSALTKWKTICQRTPNSSLDPQNAEGPVPFTSAAFLAMAFARLHLDLGPCRNLRTRDPKQVAAAILASPVPECGGPVIPALLHSAHSLSVPVMLGVDHVLGSQSLFWNCEHSLCGFESGIFLWRWLQSAGESGSWDDLDADEKGIVSWVLFSIKEALESVPASDLGIRDDTVLSQLSFPRLGILVLKLWARIFSSRRSWAITQEIGESLRLLAEAVEAS